MTFSYRHILYQDDIYLLSKTKGHMNERVCMHTCSLNGVYGGQVYTGSSSTAKIVLN